MIRAACAAAACMAVASAAAQGRWENITAGGALRPGVYGQIAVQGTPPPVLRPQPTQVRRPTADARREPVYVYVPTGQVRRWAQHCARWSACDRPVYFVRVDDSPGRLGAWKKALSQPAATSSAVLHASSRFVQ